MRRTKKKDMIKVVFDKIFFDPSFHRYTVKLSSQEKEDRFSLHIPFQIAREEGVAFSFLLVDPLVRKIFKKLRLKVGDLVLWHEDGVWKGGVEIFWGWWRKCIELLPLDVVRFSIEFHRPILVERNMALPFIQNAKDDEKKHAMRAIFIPRFGGRSDFPHEEIM